MIVNSVEMNNALGHLRDLANSVTKHGYSKSVIISDGFVKCVAHQDEISLNVKVDKYESDVVVGFDHLSQICSLSKCDLEILEDSGKIVISGENESRPFSYNLVGVIYQLPFAEHGLEGSIEFEIPDLAEGIRKVLPFISINDHRRILTGVNISAHEGVLYICGTDGKKMATFKSDYDGEYFEPLTIPCTIARQVSELNATKVRVSGEIVEFYSDTAKILCSKLTGNYPKPKDFVGMELEYKVEVDAKKFTGAMKAGHKISSERKDSVVTLEFKSGTITVKADAVDIGNAECEIDCVGGPDETVSVNINSRFALILCRMFESEVVDISFTSPSKPVIFNQGGNYPLLIMPVKR